jgi:hypothetical protein
MSISLTLSLDQVKSIVRQCSLEEKIEIAHFLEEETFETRFNRLLQQLKTDDLSLEEITQEVETVRQQRYERTHPSRH